MKLIDNNASIEQIGSITEQNTFKMKSSRKAFQILSDLYSDKALAIVRELGCNASDSMVMAGKAGESFHIHLPNTLEPWLTIEDYGTGITHDNIYSIYATYFESTKTNSNEQIGCLGLGSKSPFCYTDNFSVISITGGVKRTYNAYFGNDGCPTIALMNQSNTSEGSGLAVQIPIKTQDFTTFQQAVLKAFRFFDVKPIITGGTITWLEEKPMFEGKGWRSYDKFGYGDAYAIMGGVTYPVDINKVDRKYYDMIRKGGLVMYFGMGEVDFTPSRESLSYCDQTIKAINDKLEFVMQDFKVRISEMLSQKDNILDALKMMYSLHNKFAYISGMAVDKGMKWKGVDVSDPSGYVKKIANPLGNNITFYKSSYYKQKISESSQIDFGGKWVVDNDKATMSRIKEWCRNNPEQKISRFSEDAYLALLEAGFPQNAFVKASDLPKPVKVSKVRSANGGTPVKRIKGIFNVYEIGNTDNTTWESIQIDSNQADVKIPKYYIVKGKTWEFGINVEGQEIKDKYKLWNLINFMGLTNRDVVMVAEQNLKYMDGAISFQEHIDNDLVLDYNADGIATTYDVSERWVSHLVSHTDYKALPNNEFKKHMDALHKIVDKYDKYKKISFLFSNKKDGKPFTYKGACKVTQMLVSKLGRWSNEEVCLVASLIKK